MKAQALKPQIKACGLFFSSLPYFLGESNSWLIFHSSGSGRLHLPIDEPFSWNVFHDETPSPQSLYHILVAEQVTYKRAQ